MRHPINSCFGLEALRCMNKFNSLPRHWSFTAGVSDMDSFVRWCHAISSLRLVRKLFTSPRRLGEWVFLGL